MKERPIDVKSNIQREKNIHRIAMLLLPFVAPFYFVLQVAGGVWEKIRGDKDKPHL